MIKAAIKRAIGWLGYDISRRCENLPEFPPDFSSEEIEIVRNVRPFTGTSPERIVSLLRAVRYVESAGINGSMVECGVWRGGSMMAIAYALMKWGKPDRNLYLFDTFEGMSAPSERDRKLVGQEPASIKFEQTRRDDSSSDWCYAPLDEVKGNLAVTGYSPSLISFVKGKVEDTLPTAAPEQIALLRLDTDWYESTRHELVHLYPRLSPGGVLVLDDYGGWLGCREAVDEYLTEHRLDLFLSRIDFTGRIAVKPL